MTVRVSWIDADGHAESVTSEPVRVAGGPVAEPPPAVTGISAEGLEEGNPAAGGVTVKLSRALASGESVAVAYRVAVYSASITAADFNEAVTLAAEVGAFGPVQTRGGNRSGSTVRIPLTAVDDAEHEADQHLGIGVRITGIAFSPAGGGDEVDLYAGAPEAVKQVQTLGFAENDPPSGNAALASLAVSAGALSPPFSAERLAYRVEVEHGVETLKVTAAAAHPAARVTVAGVAVESGAESGPIALAVGETAIVVGVTAQDGTLRSYTLTVERAAGNRAPVFEGRERGHPQPGGERGGGRGGGTGSGGERRGRRPAHLPPGRG